MVPLLWATPLLGLGGLSLFRKDSASTRIVVLDSRPLGGTCSALLVGMNSRSNANTNTRHMPVMPSHYLAILTADGYRWEGKSSEDIPFSEGHMVKRARDDIRYAFAGER